VSFDVVVAADLDWGIGKANALPWPPLKGDMAHFRRVTSACEAGKRNAIIMGRKTWESGEMNGKPLPKRLNIVITRSASYGVPAGVVVASSLDAALAAAAAAPDLENTFVIGGAEILREAFVHRELRYVYLTRVDGRFDTVVRIPDLDALGFTKTAWDGEVSGEDSGVRYRIQRLTPSAR
jgi:dihydrofolate reductase/thymidylate synthase